MHSHTAAAMQEAAAHTGDANAAAAAAASSSSYAVAASSTVAIPASHTAAASSTSSGIQAALTVPRSSPAAPSSTALSASALADSAAATVDSDDESDSESDSEPPALIRLPRATAAAAGAHTPSIAALDCPTRRCFTQSEQQRMCDVLAAEPNVLNNRRRQHVLFPQLAAELSVRGDWVTAGQIRDFFQRRSAEARQQADHSRAIAQSTTTAATAMPMASLSAPAASASPAAASASASTVVTPVSSSSLDAPLTDMSSAAAATDRAPISRRRFSQAEKIRLRSAITQGVGLGRADEERLFEQLAEELSLREPVTVKQLRRWMVHHKREREAAQFAAVTALSAAAASNAPLLPSSLPPFVAMLSSTPSALASTVAASDSTGSSNALSASTPPSSAAPAPTTETIPLRNFTTDELLLMQQAIVSGVSADRLAARFSMREPMSVQQVHVWMQTCTVEAFRAVATPGMINGAVASGNPSAQWVASAWLALASASVIESTARQHLLTAQMDAMPAQASASFDLLSPPSAAPCPAVPGDCPHCNAPLKIVSARHIAACALRTPDERIAAEKQRVQQRAREAEARKRRLARKAEEAAAAAAEAAFPTVAALHTPTLLSTSSQSVVPLSLSSPTAVVSSPSLVSLRTSADAISPSASDAPAMLDGRKRPSATAAAVALQPGAAAADVLPFPPPGCVSFGLFPMEWYNSLDDSTPLNFLFSAHNVMHPSVSAALRKSEEDNHTKSKAQAEWGCTCPNGVCWPATCPCSAAGRTTYSRHGKLLLQPGEHPEYVVECCSTCSCNVTHQAAVSNDGMERAASTTTVASPIMVAAPSDLSRMQTEQSTMSDVAVADSPATSDAAAAAPAPVASDPTLVLSAPLPADALAFIVAEDVFAVATTGVPHRVLAPNEVSPSPSPPPQPAAAVTMQTIAVAGSSDSSPALADSPATAAGASSPSTSVPRPLPLRCFNRVLQLGAVSSNLRLVVFKTIDKGWALKTLTRIPRFSFVCEYIGELIHEHISEFRGAQLAKRKRSNYLFTPALSSKAATEEHRKVSNQNVDQPVRSPGGAKPPPAADDSYDIDRECFSIDSSQVRIGAMQH